ncbi:zinc dependent phospholipase C family protein [Chitinophagaceae bacterium LB-8]|uniref:Zinc dependent phospholipase C family protein n=1 Tax=Paraflavisolibacter caeni TaxID=2982496 RepID=A0A9X2XSJ7_9BACT|nr:zinc dependent phospholipase C family protein [Paraflavisolibacter caeni]MCU7548126.1 zinc dependent phospholipase C family protein [Paraflavisolibacter caeni]
MRIGKRFLLSVCFILGTVLLSGWGFLAHRTINQLAIYQLPKAMRPFFYENMDYLVKNSVRPDQRRNSDKSEEPKHYIDAEAYGDSALWVMPHQWDNAVAKYSKDTLLAYGYVPYWVMVMKERLTNAFKQENKDSILFYAADMGHYIADAHVPLHTTMNYDGQLTGQKGLHSLWESTIPEIELSQFELNEKHKAKYLKNPEQAIWEAAREANVLLKDVFQQEIEASRGLEDSAKFRMQMRYGKMSRVYTTEFAKAYNKRLGNTVNQQLLKAAHLNADFWYTCWVDAGKPGLKSLVTNANDKKVKKKMKAEWKAYKKNQLIEKDLLLAKQFDKE